MMPEDSGRFTLLEIGKSRLFTHTFPIIPEDSVNFTLFRTGKFRPWRFTFLICSHTLLSQWCNFPVLTRPSSGLQTAIFLSTQSDFLVYTQRFSGLHSHILVYPQRFFDLLTAIFRSTHSGSPNTLCKYRGTLQQFKEIPSTAYSYFNV